MKTAVDLALALFLGAYAATAQGVARSPANGGSKLSETAVQSISMAGAAGAATAAAKTAREVLTVREAEVLHLLADGLTSREIAVRLGIGFKTATSHRNNILTKLGVHSTVSAVRWAIRKGMVEP